MIALSPAIAAPKDTQFPGSISLAVGLSDVRHRIFTVHEVIPVTEGKLTLLYPEWIPGVHADSGPIQKMAGLVFRANGKRLSWLRDSIDIYAFHLDIPPGVSTLDVTFDYLTAVGPGTGRIEFTSQMLDLSWNTVLLYPAGYYSRQIRFRPSVTLPAGWEFASALEKKAQNGEVVTFRETTLNQLVDSPLAAGAYFERVSLAPDHTVPIDLDVFADDAKYLKIEASQLDEHKRLVSEALQLFGTRHFAHYDFLLMLSNSIGGQGLEHHQSSEDATEADYFTNWAAQTPKNDLLAHEFVHSWNGKFRRPDTLWTANFNTAMRGDLLWVYEGLTEYWGYQLAARAGLRTPAETRDLLAAAAAGMEANRGRQWRPLADTGNQPVLSVHGGAPWPNWERSSDYYMEGMLVWLDVDMTIRELSHDTRSLDDFAKQFYGIHDASIATETYDLDDVAEALNRVQPYAWKEFLRFRVYEIQDQVPVEGFTRAGYRLIYNDTMPDWMKSAKAAYIPGQNVASLGFTGNGSYATSLGFSVTPGALLSRVWWGSPAYDAGLLPGMQFLEVNGEPYTETKLREAILQSEGNTQPIRLLMQEGAQRTEFKLSYHQGLRYPHLEKIPDAPDRLTTMLAQTIR